MDLSSVKTVLVIKPSSLGDVVHTMAPVTAMKAQFPHLSIRWVVNRQWAPLLEGHPALEGLVIFPRDELRGVARLPQAFSWMRALKALQPDLALDFQGLLRSALMGRFARAARTVGLTGAREGAGFFYDRKAPAPRGLHAIDRYFALVESLGVERIPGALHFGFSEGVAPRAEVPGDEFVVLHSWSRGEGKSLSEQQVRRFCEALAPRPVVLVGGGPAGQLAAENAIDLTGSTGIVELLWLVRRAAWTVSVDSGPMHLAAAVSDRVLGIHTWSDPRAVGPCRGSCLVWKSGRIRRVAELADDDPELDENREAKESKLTLEDIEAIAARIGKELDGK
ncbi:MAG: glycosyltransferase family 9 protein [Verrucomicrobiales bacterium]